MQEVPVCCTTAGRCILNMSGEHSWDDECLSISYASGLGLLCALLAGEVIGKHKYIRKTRKSLLQTLLPRLVHFLQYYGLQGL